jgi:hypothetical protein
MLQGCKSVSVAFRTAVAIVIGAIAGCGGRPDGPVLYPVSGKVLIDGKPAAGGTVSLRDEHLLQPSGVIGSDGTYFVRTRDQEGAPAGSYRVVVFVTEPTAKGSDGNTGLPRLIVNKRYINESSTPLRIEVKDTPSAPQFDLEVTR